MNYYIRKKDLAVAIEKCETALHFAQTEYDKTYGKIFEDLLGILKPLYEANGAHNKIKNIEYK